MIGIIALMAIIGIILAWINLPGTFLFLLLIFLFDIFLEKTFHYSLNLPENYLLWMLCIFIIAEIIEFLLNAVMVKTYGGKNSSAFISIIGAILGAIIGNTILPIIGGFIGLIVGAYLLTYYNESIMGADDKKASNIAKSTTWGYVISKSMKSLLILIFVFYLMI